MTEVAVVTVNAKLLPVEPPPCEYTVTLSEDEARLLYWISLRKITLPDQYAKQRDGHSRSEMYEFVKNLEAALLRAGINRTTSWG